MRVQGAAKAFTVSLGLVVAAWGCASDDAPGGGPGEGTQAAACLEDRRAVGPDEVLALGFAARDVLAFVEGTHAAAIAWPDGSRGQLRTEVTVLGTSFVTGRKNPAHTTDEVVRCPDHLLVVADVALKTDDGQLDERLPKLELRATAAMSARGARTLEKKDVRGAYRFGPMTGCLLSLQFNLTFGGDRTGGARGEILQTVAGDACDRLRPTTGVSPGPGGIWPAAPVP